MNTSLQSRAKDSLVKISGEDLGPGSLYEMFSCGVKAVILENDGRALQLWNALLGSGDGKGEDNREVLPWESSLSDIARNHQARKGVGSHIGDVLFYSQNNLAYIARKMILFEDFGNKKLRTIPECFFNGSRQFILSQRIRQLVWELGSEVFQSVLPAESERLPYCMSIERLKYEDCYYNIDNLIELLKNSSSSGKWAELGRKVENSKNMATGPLNLPIVRDLFGVVSQIPGIRVFVSRMNELFRSPSKMASLDENVEIVGKPHTDGRLISCLSSLRDSIKTEIYDGEKWIELPLTRDSLAIIPGRGLDGINGIKPTLHRVLHLTGTLGSESTGPNTTLILGLRSIERVKTIEGLSL